MKRIITILLALVALTVTAQQMPPVPVDAAYRIGKLDNGMTYYIRHNEYPEHVANFYIAQRVGSIQEEDTQRGLAHFLEHMAFNGSTHFEGNGIIEYTRSLGVAFGRDLNAYTSIEQTVYNIDNVPTTRQSALDSCLLILQDWSNGLLLLSEEIDKERGVIHGEWAMRNSANQRLLERNLPTLYPGNRYGERLPIGTMEVVDNFKPEELRAYYRKWYHPENQALIIVGDIDVDHTEAKIKELFSDIKAGPEAAHVAPIAVADNNEAIYVSDRDKEMQNTVFEVMLKSDPMPEQLHGTVAEYLDAYIKSLIRLMFGERSSELQLQPDCPFVQLSMNAGRYIFSSTKDAVNVSVVAKEGKERESLQALIRETRRVKEFGFTGSEFVRAKEEFLSQREKTYSNRNKRKHTAYYSQCVANFLHGDAMPDAEVEYKIWQQVAQMLPLEAINQAAQQMLTIDNDTNLVCILFDREREGVEPISTDMMKQIVAETRAEQLSAWVDNTKDEPLLASLPKAGKIKKESVNAQLGYTEWVLSNGATVLVKKTDFKDDEVLLTGYAAGGKAQYGEADYSNLKVFDYFANSSSLGTFTSNDLQKALAGKQCGTTLSLGNRYNTLSGHSTPKDLETMFQLLYLQFTDLQKDTQAYQSLMQQLPEVLKNRDLRPETTFSDTLSALLWNHNARFAPLTLADLPNINPERILAMAKANFASVNGFTFVIVGNFDEAQLRQLVCQYIGALPGKGKAVKTKDIRTLFSGDIDCHFTRKMETPKPNIAQYYQHKSAYTLRNRVLNAYVSRVLSMMLLKSVREDAGASYSVSASIQTSHSPEQTYSLLNLRAPISTTEKVDTALVLFGQGLEELKAQADADMVEKVKANLLKQAGVDAKSNSHWLDIIEDYKMNGIDMQSDYERIVSEVTPADVSQHLRDLLKDANRLSVVMIPEE